MEAQPLPTVPLAPETAVARAGELHAPRVVARAMLGRIGWDAGQRLQDAVYARMPASRKMAVALRWRDMQLAMLRRQLAAGNPAPRLRVYERWRLSALSGRVSPARYRL